MSASITLAGPDHADQLDSLVSAFHAETGIALSQSDREAGLKPLLEGSPYGAIYLIGPVRAPIGYLVVTFGWSVEFAGMDSFVDEIYLRPSVRRRGIASEALRQVPRALKEAGVKAMHLEVDREDAGRIRFYEKAGFRLRDRYALMSRKL